MTLWQPDANVEAARKLPDWKEFHRLCGSGSGKGLCFDEFKRDGRQYTVLAFTPEPTHVGGWKMRALATGRGRTVLDALFDAYRQSGIVVPGAEELIARRLEGAAAAAADDDFSVLLGDDFEGLLG